MSTFDLFFTFFCFCIWLTFVFLFDLKGKVNDATKVQTVLFSATLPSWVNHVCYLTDSHVVLPFLSIYVLSFAHSHK